MLGLKLNHVSNPSPCTPPTPTPPYFKWSLDCCITKGEQWVATKFFLTISRMYVLFHSALKWELYFWISRWVYRLKQWIMTTRLSINNVVISRFQLNIWRGLSTDCCRNSLQRQKFMTRSSMNWNGCGSGWGGCQKSDCCKIFCWKGKSAKLIQS